ncbi:uncharacterized protein [Amphiura filiformis]|uniref:uncharacterized protein n=1 Tax=Amphiura filiformis TaxID=82378 RepID=UPI003B210EA9
MANMTKLKICGIISWLLGLLLLTVMMISSSSYPVHIGQYWSDSVFQTLRKERKAPAEVSTSSSQRSISDIHRTYLSIQNQPERDEIENKKYESKNKTISLPVYSELDFEKGMPELDLLWRRLVIVTAFSENHSKEGMWMIASAQRHMPNQRIVFYDLGVSKKTLLKLTSVCNVEIRIFDFTKYPKYVADLHNYAWKVLIIKETLFEFGAIFYGDSSVRFQTSLRELFPYLHLHHGFMFHILSYDAKVPGEAQKPLLNMTHQAIFRQLQVDTREYNNSYNVTPHISAGRVLLVNNSVINEKVLSPLFNCVMRKQCISPDGADRYNHHFDQSAISILLYKGMRGEWSYENRETSTYQFDKVVKIERSGVKRLPSKDLCMHTNNKIGF